MTHSPASTVSAVPQPRDLSGNVKAEIGLAPRSSVSTVHSLAALWAKKYVMGLSASPTEVLQAGQEPWSLAKTTAQLQQTLNRATAQAWSQAELLLSEEVVRHGIAPNLIDPWEISSDTRQLFQKAIQAYADEVPPQRLSVMVSRDCGAIRQKYTACDPRVIGFVSMQFHYTGLCLLEYLPPVARSQVEAYFKVMDDHMYMPLQAAYQAAAQHEANSPVLKAVQNLLPASTAIAHAVCNHVVRTYPGYKSHSGALSSRAVRVSSIRDVEMFQVYLCLCTLSNSISAVQRELFPLCVMLYPRLRVSWKLVQEMLGTMGWEMHDRMAPEDVAVFLPYLKTLTEMFSIDLFQQDLDEGRAVSS